MRGFSSKKIDHRAGERGYQSGCHRGKFRGRKLRNQKHTAQRRRTKEKTRSRQETASGEQIEKGGDTSIIWRESGLISGGGGEPVRRPKMEMLGRRWKETLETSTKKPSMESSTRQKDKKWWAPRKKGRRAREKHSSRAVGMRPNRPTGFFL